MHSIETQYLELQNSIIIEKLHSSVTYSTPVNFKEALALPRHRWFPYKEGFSPSFVSNFFKENLPKNFKIIDPFSGSGTTALVAAQMGQTGLGIDVNPLVNFVANVKSTSLSKSEFKNFEIQIIDFKKATPKRQKTPPENETVLSYFSKHFLEAALRISLYIDSIENSKVRNLFKLSFLSQLEYFSTHRKAGNGLKRKTDSKLLNSLNANEAFDLFKQKMLVNLNLFANDLTTSSITGSAKFLQTNSLDFEINPSERVDLFDGALTSPPYANCFDYSKIYCVELWFGDFFKTRDDQKHFRMQSVRSHVHATWPDRHQQLGSNVVKQFVKPFLSEADLWSNKIPSMLEGYFCDLGKLLQQTNRQIKIGSPFGIVVSNSAYGGIPIATDLIISEIAAKFGFETEKIVVYRGIIPSSQQYANLVFGEDLMRESLVVLRKVANDK